MGEDMEMITVKSQNGDKFTLARDVASMSTLLKNMIDDTGCEEEIPLPNVKSQILQKVIDYCTYHKDAVPEEISKPLKAANLAECGVSDWDLEFLAVEQDVLFEIVLAANYLDIRSLLDLACASIAASLKGKTPAEIRQHFGISNDFTPEEEAAIREENKWCEDA